MTASERPPADAPPQSTPDASLRRRSLLTGLATAMPAAALAQSSAPPIAPAQVATGATQTPAAHPADDPCQFLNPRERRSLEALTARIIPTDDLGPGAVQAGVVVFLDRQLAGACNRTWIDRRRDRPAGRILCRGPLNGRLCSGSFGELIRPTH